MAHTLFFHNHSVHARRRGIQFPAHVHQLLIPRHTRQESSRITSVFNKPALGIQRERTGIVSNDLQLKLRIFRSRRACNAGIDQRATNTDSPILTYHTDAQLSSMPYFARRSHLLDTRRSNDDTIDDTDEFEGTQGAYDAGRTTKRAASYARNARKSDAASAAGKVEGSAKRASALGAKKSGAARASGASGAQA